MTSGPEACSSLYPFRMPIGRLAGRCCARGRAHPVLFRVAFQAERRNTEIAKAIGTPLTRLDVTPYHRFRNRIWLPDSGSGPGCGSAAARARLAIRKAAVWTG